MQFIIDQWKGTPPITRSIFLITFGLSLGVTLECFTLLKLYFNWKLIYTDGQVWRLITSLFFMGELSPHTIFQFFICFRYLYHLETTTFRNRPEDLITFLTLGCTFFLVSAFFLGLQNMSGSVSTMMLYMWSRKNPNIELSFLDVFHFRSCFLPYFIFLMTLLTGFDVTLDLLGIIAGHVYFFMEDVVPRVPETRGIRVLKAPNVLKRICDWLNIHDFGANDHMNNGGGAMGWLGGGLVDEGNDEAEI